MEFDLQDEIRVLSKLILRLENISDHCDDQDVLMKLTDQVGKAATRKSNLMKAQQALNPQSNELDQMLIKALNEVAREMGLAK